jgi:hypothetical protein
MSDELTRALDAVARRVLALAGQDPDLRSSLRALAQAYLSATADHPAGPDAATGTAAEEAQEAAAAPPPAGVVRPAAVARSVAPPAEPPRVAAHPTDGFRLASPTPPAREVRPDEPTWLGAARGLPDLRVIEARCRLKAEGTRWARTRRRRLAEGADFVTEIDPQDRDIIDRAKALPDCFLWMNTPSAPSPADPSLLDTVAGCFDAVADAVALARAVTADLENNQGFLARVLDLTAEAQSALRSALLRIDGPKDVDQLQVFVWLKETAAAHRMFIHRFMRVDDTAEAGRWGDLVARIEGVNEQLEENKHRARQRKKLLGNLRYKLQKFAGEAGGDRPQRWHEVAVLVDQLVQAGVPPSNVEVRELLLPVLDDAPHLDELPAGFQRVLREIEPFLASGPAEAEAAPAGPSEQVKQAARLLAGKSAVLIGGDPRPDTARALETSFGLRELYWIATREHQSLEGFEPYVARPDVAVVLLGIRWSSHSYGDVKQFCDRYDKPLVRLPAGYNANQVAHQILAQCGERLGGGF